LVACQSKDETIQKDKELGQQLDTLTCITGVINFTDASHGFLFDRLEAVRVSGKNVLFGKYSFEVNCFTNGQYLLTNPSGPYSLHITTKDVESTPAGGSIKTMKITKLCDN